MIVNHRPGSGDTEYTLAMDKVEFIAMTTAVGFALDMISDHGDTLTDEDSRRLQIIFAAMKVELAHPNVRLRAEV